MNHSQEQKLYLERHPNMKIKAREQTRKYKRRVRIELMELLGGTKCVRCGFDDYRALQLDHLNGGGNDDRRKLGGNDVEAAFYLKNPELAKRTLQILCANCNWIKKHEKKEHPKEGSKK